MRRNKSPGCSLRSTAVCENQNTTHNPDVDGDFLRLAWFRHVTHGRGQPRGQVAELHVPAYGGLPSSQWGAQNVTESLSQLRAVGFFVNISIMFN